MLNPEYRGVDSQTSVSTLKLSLAASNAREVLAALSHAAEALPGFRDALLDLFEIIEEPFVVELDRLAAPRADEVVMRLYPSDSLLRLVAAFRARQPEFFPVEHFPLMVGEGDINTIQGDTQCWQ